MAQILDNCESLDSVMKLQKVPLFERQEVRNYLHFAYLGTNRTTIRQRATLLYSIPKRILITETQFNLIKEQAFFNAQEFIVYLVENSRFLFFPPRVYLFRGGDLFAGYFIIKKGYILEIDLLGNVMVRGPGDSVGMLSLFVAQHVTTAVTHTYVHVNYVDSALFVEALQLCPRARCRFEYAFLTLEDRFEIIREVLTDDSNVEKHLMEVHFHNLENDFLFNNYPRGGIRAFRDKRRYVTTYIHEANFVTVFTPRVANNMLPLIDRIDGLMVFRQSVGSIDNFCSL